MSLLNYSIKNMIGGVSQQPPSIRLPSQCGEMINCLPSVTDFLKRRPGAEGIGRLADNLPDSAFIDFIRRGDREAGLLIIYGGAAYVYDLSCKLIGSVTNSYFQCDNPKDKLKLLTIKDYNFILNKSKPATSRLELNSDVMAYLGDWPYVTVFVKQAAYNTEYTLTIRGRKYYYKTPSNSDFDYVLSTSEIVEQLSARMSIEGQRPENVSIETYKNIIIIKNLKDASGLYYGNFNVSCDDGMGNSYITSFYNEMQSVSELPLRGLGGNVIRIRGDKSTEHDDYFVEFVRAKDTVGEGYWKECAKGDMRRMPETMPVALNITSSGVSVNNIVWKGRKAGDDTTCPDPSFLDKRLCDIFFYNNRLCFLTEDTVCMSEAGEYFNFFNTTATALLDSDPIDVAVSGTKVSPLRYAVPYNEGLFLYSDTALFAAEHGDVLSTANISIRPVIQFDTELTARPVVVDTSIFYTTSRGAYSAIREYRPDSSGDLYGYSGDITAHVPSYIPAGIKKITASMEESAVFALTGGKEIYVYNYQNGSGRERIQSAWGKWTFRGKVLNAEIINGVLYMAVSYQEDNQPVYLERIILNGTGGSMTDRAGDFISSYTYSTQYIGRDASYPSITAGRTQLRTLTVKYADSGPFKIIIERRGRKPEERIIIPATPSGEARVAILARNEDVNIRIESIGANQFKLIESRFEAVFTARSKLI